MCITNKTNRFKGFPEFDAWKVISKRDGEWCTGPYTRTVAVSTWQTAKDLPHENDGSLTKETDVNGDYGFNVFETYEGACHYYCYIDFPLLTRVTKVKCRGDVVLGNCEGMNAAYVSQIRFEEVL